MMCGVLSVWCSLDHSMMHSDGLGSVDPGTDVAEQVQSTEGV
jgi:hypothetical protein